MQQITKGLRSVSNIGLFILLIPLILTLQANSQTVRIDGVISTVSSSVANASVTFISNADTTNQIATTTDRSGNYQINLTMAVKSEIQTPSHYKLEQNYPNPFSSTTAIAYELNTQTRAAITIFDILGRKVKQYKLGFQPTGVYNVVWDGKNHIGEQVAPGIYFYRLHVKGKSFVKKMLYNPQQSNTFNFQPRIEARKSYNQNNLSKANNAQETIYTVRIENTDQTYPQIVPVEFEQIAIQNDTSINFTVEEKIIVNPALVNFDSTHQIIRGFGAANIVGWRPNMTDDEIEKAFGTGDGKLGFSILRLRIQPDNNNWIYNVSTAKKAYDMGVKIIAAPWTPPASMKTNNSTIGGRLKEDSYADFAEYLASFVDYMEDNEVPIYAVSVQNEPDVDVNYESCDYNATEMLKFVKENAPAIGTRVMAPESFHFDHSLSDPLLKDQGALSNLGMVAGHIYGGGLEPYPLAREKGKEMWMTEHFTDSQHSANLWPMALEVGTEIHDCMVADFNAYVWWYIVRYYGPIGDGERSQSYPREDFADKGEITKRGYIMSHYSRFVRPGYHRIESTENPTKNIYISAYKNDAKVVIVAINNGYQAINQTFTLQDGTFDKFTPFVTTETKNVVQESSLTTTDGSFNMTLPGKSIITFVSE
ncbi:MAG: T9SS type A sorting domain-containing protein [Candidatus Marinimicrobia bacterium]|nr:T9SS type A sorting domain-containing protein [Candidatus Neomarinimicrobiota bacterium]